MQCSDSNDRVLNLNRVPKVRVAKKRYIISDTASAPRLISSKELIYIVSIRSLELLSVALSVFLFKRRRRLSPSEALKGGTHTLQ